MKNSVATLRDAGSFVAGILIGLSVVVPVFALTVVNLTDWQTVLLYGAPFALAVGITLQAVITAKARHVRAISTAPGWHAVRQLTRDV
jgi:hypothetical protein